MSSDDEPDPYSRSVDDLAGDGIVCVVGRFDSVCLLSSRTLKPVFPKLGGTDWELPTFGPVVRVCALPGSRIITTAYDKPFMLGVYDVLRWIRRKLQEGKVKKGAEAETSDVALECVVGVKESLQTSWNVPVDWKGQGEAGGHNSWMWGLDVVPGGAGHSQCRAIAGDNSRTVKVYDLGSGKTLHQLLENAPGVTLAITHLPAVEGRAVFVAGRDDSNVRHYDIDAGKCLRSLRGPSSDVWGLTTTAGPVWESDLVFAGSYGKLIHCWSMKSNEVVHSVKTDQSCYSVCASTSAPIVYVGTRGMVKAWDLRKPDDKVSVVHLMGNDDVDAIVQLDRDTFISSTWDRFIGKWSTAGKSLAKAHGLFQSATTNLTVATDGLFRDGLVVDGVAEEVEEWERVQFGVETTVARQFQIEMSSASLQCWRLLLRQ